MKENLIYALMAVVIVIGGISIGAVYYSEINQKSSTGPPGTTQNSTSTPYSLTLVITTKNQFNATVGEQPAFYVLNDGKLQSSANISLPSGHEISLTVVNYDDGAATTDPKYANVTGTTNNEVSIFNNTNINSTSAGGGIGVTGGAKVTAVSNGSIAHTFTILSGSRTVVNIPILPLSTEQATFTLSPGTYTWQCEAACGSGTSGWQGAMSTPGWMTGTVYASSSVTVPTYYSLTMMVTTENWFNGAVGAQPAFYVLENGNLLSSANVTLPAGVTIVATIINYDDGAASTDPKYANVTGTTSNQISIFNNTNINSSEGSGSISVNGTSPVSQVPDAIVAHTFTVLSGSSVQVNIPLVPSSITQASFTLTSGVYAWQCEAACGSGSTGWEGAMSTPGWMTGTVDVQ